MKSYLLLFVVLSLSYSTDAQFDKIKKQLEEKMAKQNQSGQQEKSEETKDQEEADLMNAMFGSAEDLDLEERYRFDFQIDWLVESSNQKETSEFKQLFSKEESYIGMIATSTEERNQNKEVKMVFDLAKSYMIIFNKEEQQAMVMSTSHIPEAVTSETNASKPVTITKTGKTKTLLDYLVEQYTYTSEDGHGEFWTTTQLDYKNRNFYEFYQQMSRRGNSEDAQYNWWRDQIEGYLLESKGTGNDGETFHMVATAINEKASVTIEVAEYKVMNMTKMGNYQNRN